MADTSGFQAFGFDDLTMTYLNPRFVPQNDDISGFTWVDLNSRYRNRDANNWHIPLLNGQDFPNPS